MHCSTIKIFFELNNFFEKDVSIKLKAISKKTNKYIDTESDETAGFIIFKLNKFALTSINDPNKLFVMASCQGNKLNCTGIKIIPNNAKV